MKLTAILMDEHRVIEQMLGVLRALAADARKTGAVHAGDAEAALDFLRTFADGCHHGKEESLLFPAVEATGLRRDAGPTGCMLHEHDLGRGHIRAMLAALPAAVQAQPAAIEEFGRAAEAYCQLLTDHIYKEDNILFPLADQRLDSAAQEALLTGAERVEHEDMGDGTHERYLAMANRLADKYGIARAQIAAATGCGCQHHHA
jgi:hemerythrin-like domain-containing protein